MASASVTSAVTSLMEQHGVVAVFLILALDAVLPVGGELPMLLAGVLCAGAIGDGAQLFGAALGTGAGAYVVLSLAGTLGYTLGAVIGWQLGSRGGREFVDRHGRWLHLDRRRIWSAEQWFKRWGSASVFLGRLTPLVRSFISVTAGIFESPFGPYLILTIAGSAIWCFSLAAAGWAAGANWDAIHGAFEQVEIGIAVLAVLTLAILAIRTRRSTSR